MGHPFNPGTCVLSLVQRSLKDPSRNKTSLRFRKATTREESRKQTPCWCQRQECTTPEHPSRGAVSSQLGHPFLTLPRTSLSRRIHTTLAQFSGTWDQLHLLLVRLCPLGSRRSRNLSPAGFSHCLSGYCQIPVWTCQLSEIQSLRECAHLLRTDRRTA